MEPRRGPEPHHYEMIYNMLSSMFGNTGMRLSVLKEDGDTYKRTHDIPELCAVMKNDSRDYPICKACTQVGMEWARNTQRPAFYRCHKGLVVTIVPVIQGGKVLAYIVFSGYLLEADVMHLLPILLGEKAMLPDSVEFPEISDFQDAIPIYTKERIDEIVQLLTMTAGYVADMANHTRLLMELQDKSLELLTIANLQEQKERKADQQKLRELQRKVWDSANFDILDQISIIAGQEGAVKTSRMLHNFSLRTRKGNNPGVRTTLGREVEEIATHISLLQDLYEGQMEFKMEITPGYDPDLEIIQLPFGTVVDLIVRGPLSQMEKGGHLICRLAQQEEYVVMSFWDNGVRAIPENISREAQLRPLKAEDDADYSTFVSMIEEAKRRFGPRFQWSFSAENGRDNLLTLYFPYGQEDLE